MAVENVIHVRATRAEVRQLIGMIPQIASGRIGGRSASDQLTTRIGLAALSKIRQAFVVKATGGTDEAGERWKPLSQKTVAYSRRHPGLARQSVRAGSRPSHALSTDQRSRWWELYRRNLARYKGDKGRAAAVAWLVLKGEGAKTLLELYGNTQVDILRDTGILLNSLSPGVPGSVPDQVFRIGVGEVIVGTNRKGAASHHQGIPGRLPQRRLWPEPSKWPASWWESILEQGRAGLIEIIIFVLQRGRQ